MAKRKGKEYSFYFKNGKVKTIKGVFWIECPENLLIVKAEKTYFLNSNEILYFTEN